MKLLTEVELSEDDATFEVHEYAPLGSEAWQLLRPYIGKPTDKFFWHRYTIPMYLYRQIVQAISK